MKIKKIKIQGDCGLKGLSVTYEKMEDKGGRTFSTDVIEEKRYPIHLGLETKIKELREYHGDICGLLAGKLSDDEVKYITNDIEIIGIKLDHDYFLLSAKVNTFNGKKIAISTPKVDQTDEYPNFDKVQKIIDEILVEVKDYMSGAKKATDEEFGQKYIQSLMKKNKEFKEGDVTLDMFNEMSPEEKKKFCSDILEKEFGSMITHQEDLEIPEEDATVITLAKQA